MAWWPKDLHGLQAISNHSIYLVFLEHSSFNTRRVKFQEIHPKFTGSKVIESIKKKNQKSVNQVAVT